MAASDAGNPGAPTSPTATSPPTAAPRPRWTHQWKELYDEVVTTGLCTGCAGCVIACPHDVIGYRHEPGGYTPFHLEDELGPGHCVHGEKGCTSCTRACPRFRAWEPEANEHLFGRDRAEGEMVGVYRDIVLLRATDSEVRERGQDGGLVSAMLIWCLENDIIDGALVSELEGDGTSWRAVPGVAATRQEVLAGAGSRYTYSANTMALPEAKARGLERLALVGMSCQSSVAPVMWHRKVGKVGKPFKVNIGLLCSKTFDDAIFDELLLTKYRVRREDIAKMNIKGVLQVWLRSGEYLEISLKECHAWTREGCVHCPDFAAEHADIATGGISSEPGWTLAVVRTELGEAIVRAMLDDGVIDSRPADEDPGAVALLHKLAAKSRERWPAWAAEPVRLGLPSRRRPDVGTTATATAPVGR